MNHPGAATTPRTSVTAIHPHAEEGPGQLVKDSNLFCHHFSKKKPEREGFSIQAQSISPLGKGRAVHSVKVTTDAFPGGNHRWPSARVYSRDCVETPPKMNTDLPRGHF